MNSGLRGERARDRDALALAAGELVRIFRAVGRIEADQLQQLADLPRDLGGALRDAEGADRLGDDVERAPARIEAGVGVLEHHLDAAAQRGAGRASCFGLLIDTPSMMTSPVVGGISPTTILATVDLPEPDSPTSAKVSRWSIEKVTSAAAVSRRRGRRSITRLSHGFETSKMRPRSFTSTSGLAARPAAARRGHALMTRPRPCTGNG